jgi:hypothetical protein
VIARHQELNGMEEFVHEVLLFYWRCHGDEYSFKRVLRGFWNSFRMSCLTWMLSLFLVSILEI